MSDSNETLVPVMNSSSEKKELRADCRDFDIRFRLSLALPQVLGKWRVEYAVKTTSTCFDMDFRQEGSLFKVYETKEPAAPERVGLDIKYGSVGTLASTAKPGYYQASFSTSEFQCRQARNAFDHTLCTIQFL